MKCKNCGTELEEGVSVCPNCGADSTRAKPEEAAPTEEKKLGTGKIVLLAVLVVAAVAVVIALVMGGLSGGEGSDAPSDGTVETTGAIETTEATIPADGNPDDVTCKGSYTVSDDEVVAARDNVVATLGDMELTVGELQVYYWLQFYDFMDYFGSYASYFGLDYTQPLDTQISADGSTTWQQYFLDSAISVWQNYAALTQKAKDAGFEMDPELAESLAQLPETLNENAQSEGFADANEMIQADMGAGASMTAYEAYLDCYYTGYLYYSSLLENLELTDAEVEAYFDENSASYAESGVEKDDSVYVDVRHILIKPEGGTTDDSGVTTYSDDEWEACRAAAQQILDQWLSGEQTEEAFAELANTYSQDPGSNTNGGLYEDVAVGQMVEPFENWCFDASRQLGDYGLVQTTFGYHVMYFVGSEPVWYAAAWEDLMTQKGNEILEQALEEYPMEIDYSAIVLGMVDLTASS